MPFWLLAAAAAAQVQPGTNPIVRDRLDQHPPVPKVVPQKRRGTTSVQAAGSSQPIRTIVFQGVQAPAEVAEAARAFLGRPATRDALVELAGALSRAYERTDIALYTVAIPDQNFRDGVVVVELIEGWVNAVQVKAPAGQRFPLLEARANKLVGEKPLSRGRFERQAALMQSIPGLKLDASFENPEGDDSVAFVLTPRQKRIEAALGIDNRGPHLLGNLIVQGGLDFYRLLTDGDQLAFSGYATPDFRHYRALDASYTLPIGIDGLTLTGSTAWIATRLKHIDIHGQARFAALALTYPVLRQARRAADVSIGVDGVNSHNALFGNVIATERSRAVRLAGAFVAASENDNFSVSASLSHGIDIFGASAGDTGAEIGFSKFNGAATYERVLVPRLLGRVNVTGQYSRDRLPAAELMSVGGIAIGRAFDTGILTGDRGIGGFVELAFRPIRSRHFDQSEVYLFGDAARLTVNRRPTFPKQTFSLASAGGGVRLKYKKRMQFGVEGAAVLDKPYPGYRKHARLSFYYTILF